MSDVKRFTGFIAIDGSTHATEKAAVTHTRDVKTAAALEKLRALVVEGAPGATSFEGIAYIESEGMPIFLAANREAILAAFNQEVLTRKKRIPKVKAASSPTVVITSDLSGFAQA